MLRIGFVTSDHLHFWSYLGGFRKRDDIELVGIWDRPGRPTEHGLKTFDSLEALLEASDAVVIVSQNLDHADHIEAAVKANKHIFCEKPLVASWKDLERVEAATRGFARTFMTAFPCRYAPSYARLKERVAAGDIGTLKAIMSTNHGIWPEHYASWFVDPARSGGGAMVDHVVHVADLMGDLLGEEPENVFAVTTHNMHSREGCEDGALVSLKYPGGVFATIDSSWSRPQNYRIWGDVTMNVVGENGVLELNMFNQNVTRYQGSARWESLAMAATTTR